MIAEQQGHRVVAMLLRQKAGKVTLGLDRHGLGFRAQVLGFREYSAPAVLYEARQEWQGHCRNVSATDGQDPENPKVQVPIS